MHSTLFYFLLISSLFFASCTQSPSPTESKGESRTKIELSHAKNFELEQQGALIFATIKSGWKGSKKPFRYLLYPKRGGIPKGFDDWIKIGIPVKGILTHSTVDIAFLSHLGVEHLIKGSSNTAFIYNDSVRAAVSDGRIVDLGNSSAIDFEKGLSTGAEVALIYSLGNDKNYKKYNELGIPAVMMADFMEETPLGRAEWMKLLGYISGVSKEANTLFDETAQAYKEIKAQAHLSIKPRILTGALFEGTWYIAGGKSLMAQFIKDAGGDYIWGKNKETSGVGLDLEAVYSKALDADIWVNVNRYNSYEALQKDQVRYTDFAPFKAKQIFNNDKRLNKAGGNDFFESAIVRPELILRDLNLIFNKKATASKLYYYRALPSIKK